MIGWGSSAAENELNDKKALIEGYKSQIPSDWPSKYKDFQSLIKKEKIGIIKMEVARSNKPNIKFLKDVRKLCDKNNIILIFDECTTGFRENYGGLHKTLGVNPDIAIFGKTLGNGYAINAIIGKKK